MKKTGLFLVMLLTVAAISVAGEGIEGAWKTIKVERLGSDGWVAEDLQPSLTIFAGGYYSTMYVPAVAGESKPRKLLPVGGDATDAQIAEAYRSIIANAGSYKVSGSELTRTVIVAKNPNFMDSGRSSKAEFTVEGDTLTTEGTSPAGTGFKVTYERLK